MIREYLLKTDSFLNPKIVTNEDATAILLLRLLIMVPGTNPLRPTMGVGIGTIYRFIPENQLNELKSVISGQISTFCPPEFQTHQIDLSINNDHCLIIKIIINNIAYIFDTKDLGAPVQLSDIIS